MNRYKMIGKLIKETRESRGISQEQLGKIIGYSHVTIGHWENGRRKISIEDLERVSQALGKPLNFFLEFEEAIKLSPQLSAILTNLSIKALPVLAKIPAGLPLLVEENIEEYITVPQELAGQADFALRVHGDSMKEAGILDGDYVLIKRQSSAEHGDIVVARLSDESVTLKKLCLEHDQIILKPANGDYSPVSVKEINIVGKVVGSFRKY